ncbi:hypothetical protein EON65_36360 [archaeon]|nr:MAG: hypothetical protein EON65_36360 [archaeon]
MWKAEGFNFGLSIAKTFLAAPATLPPTSISFTGLQLSAKEVHISKIEASESNEVEAEAPAVAKTKRAPRATKVQVTSTDSTENDLTVTKKKRAPKSPKLSGNSTEVGEIKKKGTPPIPKSKDANTSAEAVKKEKKGKKKEVPPTPRQASGYNFITEDDEFPDVQEPKWYATYIPQPLFSYCGCTKQAHEYISTSKLINTFIQVFNGILL